MTLQEIQGKARFGHRDWVCWHDRNDLFHAERESAESVKKALLSVGTQGRFVVVEANTGHLHLTGWWVGLNIIRQYRRGYRR